MLICRLIRNESCEVKLSYTALYFHSGNYVGKRKLNLIHENWKKNQDEP